jgi:predicted dehydrogenase
MKKIGVGIIGQGRSGRDIHGAQLSKMPDMFRIVAVSDPLKERRDRAVSEYGCAAYADHRAFFRLDDIGLIVNTSPSNLHVPLSVECMKAGFNVVCEKPLARTVAEVDKAVRVSKETRKMLAVFQQRRFEATFLKLREIVDSGVLGRIVEIKVRAGGFARRWDWQTLRRKYGGSLLNTGPHLVDQALQLFGTDAMPDVWCSMDRANTYGDAEDHVKLLLSGRGRPTIDIEISSCCAYKSPDFNVFGTRGGALVSKDTVEWKFFKLREQTRRSLDLNPIVNEAGLPAYCGEKLVWHEQRWEAPADSEPATAVFYKRLHKSLSRGTSFAITMAEIRQQIAVMEECHRLNPPSRMPRADMA